MRYRIFWMRASRVLSAISFICAAVIALCCFLPAPPKSNEHLAGYVILALFVIAWFATFVDNLILTRWARISGLFTKNLHSVRIVTVEEAQP